jgi:perosamine synthetase
METLAVLGGNPVLAETLPPYRSMGEAEVSAVTDVVRSDCLSGFYGSWGDQFLGGPRVRELEQAWAARFGTRYCISVNSCTSGLSAAMGAVGIGPGDEVIVPPYTMSATAMAPLIYGGIPVFADIDPDTFCLDVAAVERAITPRTRAIIAVNLFGHPAPLTALRTLADARGLVLIEDNAQGPLAREGDRFAGTIGHIGVFSLNYHKHIHSGEGGVCVTDDESLAIRLQLIRNHGENVVEALGMETVPNIVGFNFRMTELSAAIAIEQLKRAEDHVAGREVTGRALSEGIADLEGLQAPVVRPGCRHVYYVWALRYDERVIGVPRDTFSAALRAEGFPHGTGYVRPLYLLPIFRNRIGIGRSGYPFNLTNIQYGDGLCPVAERMHYHELITFEPCAYTVDAASRDRLVEAIRKVHRNRHQLLTAPQVASA